MMLNLSKKLKAISLVETLVYLGIFALIFTTIVTFMLTIIENNNRTIVRQKVSTYKIFLYDKIEEDTINTISINEADSILNNDTGKLSLVMSGGATTKYYLNSGKLYIDRGGVVTNITPADASFSLFRLEPIYNDDNVITSIDVSVQYSINQTVDYAGSFRYTYKIR